MGDVVAILMTQVRRYISNCAPSSILGMRIPGQGLWWFSGTLPARAHLPIFSWAFAASVTSPLSQASRKAQASCGGMGWHQQLPSAACARVSVHGGIRAGLGTAFSVFRRQETKDTMKSSAFVHNISLTRNSAGCAPEDSWGGWGFFLRLWCQRSQHPWRGSCRVCKRRCTPHRKTVECDRGPGCCGEDGVARLSETG